MPKSSNNKSRFDFNKPRKREFDFTKDDEIDEVPSILKSNWRNWSTWPSWAKWVVYMAIIIAVVIFILFCLKSCGNESQVKEGETTEETSAAAQPADEQENGELVPPKGDASAPEATDVAEPDVATESSDGASQSQESNKPSEHATTNPAQPTSPNTPSAPARDIEAEALNVIRGDYGNAPVRYDLLRQKGLDVQAIQRRVNELKREGVF